MIATPSRLFPTQSVSREALAAAGVLDLSRAPGLNPANSGSETQVDQLSDPQSSGAAQFNLRNLEVRPAPPQS